MRSIVVGLCVVLALTLLVTAQEKKPLSPPGTAEVALDGKKVSIAYSRPSMRGRKIYGGLVPYGEEWRTGANAATSFTTEADLDIGGTSVPKGAYTLYTLPGENGWKLIISKKTGQWGIPYPGDDDDLARIDMKTSKLPSPVEQFTISFEPKGSNAATLNLDWETTRASVDVKTK